MIAASVWSEPLLTWGDENETTVKEVFRISTEYVAGSVLVGSGVTGAPGQPVKSRNLIDSFIQEFLDDWTWQIATTGIAPDGSEVGYAQFIEDGANDVAFFDPSRQSGQGHERSQVGGYHSIKLTESGWFDIVDIAAQRLNGHVVFQ